MKIIKVVGARPNFVKIAPIISEVKKYPVIKYILVHSGQHYDKLMSDVFFKELDISKPDISLGVGSASHAAQTAQIMEKFEEVCLKEAPDLILIVGDVNTTLASALVAVKLGIKIAHVEAGLRSFDRSMPEEINRVLVDQISDYLFITEESAYYNLIKEGIDKKKIYFVGNVMIDSLIKNLNNKTAIVEKLELIPREYCLVTMHRPSNVDNPEKLKEILGILQKINIPIVWPIHPRTKKNIDKFGFNDLAKDLKLIEPLSYLNFISLLSDCKFVLTDSGGVQEETTYLGIPCITLRETTERPITVQRGTNVLANTKKEINESIDKIMRNKKFYYKKRDIPKWDGKASQRIVSILLNDFLAS